MQWQSRRGIRCEGGGGGGPREARSRCGSAASIGNGGTLMRRSKGPCSGVDVPT